MRFLEIIETDAPVLTTKWHDAAPNLTGISRRGGLAAAGSICPWSLSVVLGKKHMMRPPFCSYRCGEFAPRFQRLCPVSKVQMCAAYFGPLVSRVGTQSNG